MENEIEWNKAYAVTTPSETRTMWPLHTAVIEEYCR